MPEVSPVLKEQNPQRIEVYLFKSGSFWMLEASLVLNKLIQK